MPEPLKSTAARTQRATARKIDTLLFTLGADPRTGDTQSYGIKLVKVREVMRGMPVTGAPDIEPPFEGVISVRGTVAPVIDLAKRLGLPTGGNGGIMIVVEHDGRTLALRVDEVETILRLDWTAITMPPGLMANETRGLVSAAAELADGRLVMMMDIENVLG